MSRRLQGVAATWAAFREQGAQHPGPTGLWLGWAIAALRQPSSGVPLELDELWRATPWLVPAAVSDTTPPNSLPALIQTPVGVAHSRDYLRTLLVAAGAATLDTGAEMASAALRESCHGLLELLAVRRGGKTIELRVPPVAAVQLAADGGGSTHTRGTPPNLVETDPLTFFQLAIGRLDWEGALGAGLWCSGAHAAEIRGAFPLVDFSEPAPQQPTDPDTQICDKCSSRLRPRS